MHEPLRNVIRSLIALPLAFMTIPLLQPYLPGRLPIYLAVGASWGAIIFLDEAFLRRNRQALRLAVTTGGLTGLVLYLLDLVL
ncbi:MAG: hypothetical protein ACOY93_01205 [Bacillota bacterium]